MKSELASTLELLHPDSFGWALHCCHGDFPRAEDVLQNAYLKVLRRPDVFAGRSEFKTWWFGVIRLTAMEEFRRITFRTSWLGRLISHNDPPPTVTPAASLELAEETAQMREMLAKLSPRQAEVLHLVFYQDLSLSAAAEIMGVGVGSARQHYDRGKQRLREMLQESTPSLAHERSQ